MSTADISKLNAARNAASQLSRLERLRDELPELERAEAERQRREAAKQQLERASFELEPAAKRYQTELKKSNLEIVELLKYVADFIRRRRVIDRQGQEVAELARKVAEARIELGHTPLGSWGNSPEENRMMLEETTRAVLKEHKAELGVIDLDDQSSQTQLMLSLLARFCTVRRAPKPESINAKKVLIKKTESGKDVYYWG